MAYQVNDCPPLGENLGFGLQWLAISVTSVIIMGKVVAGMHFTDAGLQVLYMQKLFFVMGGCMLVQVLWGHGLPLVTGPAMALIVGILAGMGRGIDSIYTSIGLGGLFLLLLNVTGLFARLTRLFTPRVVASILILIALSITPVIVKLVTSSSVPGAGSIQLGFSLVFLLLMIAGDYMLRGIWKSTMLVWAILGGSVVIHWLLGGQHAPPVGMNLPLAGLFFRDMTTTFGWDPGLLLAFLICIMALAINDLGSIHAVGTLVKAPDMESRVRKGITVTGVWNIIAGFLGVIGPVNFSLSAGIIASNGNGSRFSLIPAALGMMGIAFVPGLVAFMGTVPQAVVGTVLLYVMSAQLSAGLVVAFEADQFSFLDGMILGVPLMVSIVISYLPPWVREEFPQILLPVLGNGFVMGVLIVLILEHCVYRSRKP